MSTFPNDRAAADFIEIAVKQALEGYGPEQRADQFNRRAFIEEARSKFGEVAGEIIDEGIRSTAWSTFEQKVRNLTQ